MSDNEIKLTTTNNTTNSGTSFPTTPKPQILKENFASVELNNLNESKKDTSKDNN